jgi:hypothetical protein
MQQPPGFDDGTGAVMLLCKSLYGLKQAPRMWHHTRTAYSFDLGCVRSQSDGVLFTFCSARQHRAHLLLYADDFQIAAEHISEVAEFKRFSLSNFKAGILGRLLSSSGCQLSVIKNAILLICGSNVISTTLSLLLV